MLDETVPARLLVRGLLASGKSIDEGGRVAVDLGCTVLERDDFARRDGLERSQAGEIVGIAEASDRIYLRAHSF
jgi:hypothetical protein